ncbi:hypothetical protein [Curtobacterium flaccumfaciens]|uniref:hypothetical protein n=1 Tax=Curtobacterium flaccumfaciens TaxID=2035 RepID=UPI0032AF8FCB
MPVPVPADDLTLAGYLRAVRGRLAPESLVSAGFPGFAARNSRCWAASASTTTRASSKGER